MDDISFQVASPMPLMSLVLLVSIFLFSIYLAKWFNDSLIFLESDDRCSSEPWREIGRKLLSHRFGSVGQLGLYGNWMLIILSSTHCVVVVLRADTLFEVCCCLLINLLSVALLIGFLSLLLSLYDNWDLSIASSNSSLGKLLLRTIFS